MRYFSITILVAILVIVGQSALAAEDMDYTALKMVEVQLGSADSATEEFVEIANTSVQPISLEGLSVQYKSKSGSTWSNKANLTGWIAPYGRILISNYLVDASTDFSGGLSGSSGHLQLSDQDGAAVDLLGWGDAAEPDGAAVETHGSGESLKRRVDEDGRFIDSDDNSSDWFASLSPTPEMDLWEVGDVVVDEPIEEATPTVDDPVVTDDQESTADPAVAAPIKPSHPLVITELLPDPKSPLKDAEHEFIELFNPNQFEVDISGYIIEAGPDWRYSHTLGSYQLAPGEYLAVYSADTGLTLSNSGSQVRLLSPSGSELFFVEYDKAKPGKSWSLIDGEWLWADPSNNITNSAAIESEEESETNVAGAADESPKIDKRSVSYPAAQSEKSEATSSTGQFTEEEAEPSRVNNWVLAGVGSLAVLYALYEYRNDIRLRIQQHRRYFAVRRENRAATKGR